MATQSFYQRFLGNRSILQSYNDFVYDKSKLDLDKLVILDTETTGTDANGQDEIIQLAFVTFQKTGKVNENNEPQYKINKFEMFVKPIWRERESLIEYFKTPRGALIPEHQIDLINKGYDSPYTARDLANILEKTLQDKIVIAHNGIGFDAVLINKNLAMFNKKVNWACLDTMTLAFKIGLKPENSDRLPEEQQTKEFLNLQPEDEREDIRFRQKDLGIYFDVANLDSHNAVGDVVQLAKIFVKMKEEAFKRGTNFYKLIEDNIQYSKIINQVLVLNKDNKKQLNSFEFFNSPIMYHLIKNQIQKKIPINQRIYDAVIENPSMQKVFSENDVKIVDDEESIAFNSTEQDTQKKTLLDYNDWLKEMYRLNQNDEEIDKDYIFSKKR